MGGGDRAQALLQPQSGRRIVSAPPVCSRIRSVASAAAMGAAASQNEPVAVIVAAPSRNASPPSSAASG